MTESSKRLRMTIDLPPSTSSRLRRLKETLEETSFVAVLRRAVHFLYVCIRAVKDGGKVVIRSPDGTDTELDVPRA